MEIPRRSAKPARTAVVVDDDPATQRFMMRSLLDTGIHARGFDDAESALAYLEQTPVLPDVIAVDVQLPRMGGLELARRIREDPRLAAVPLVLTTARQHADDQAAAMALGAGFLPKPFRVREYLATLQRLLATSSAPPLVLIVDDDAGIREALVDIIAEEGFETTSAPDGREALKILTSERRPALVILDLMMPGMDGIELAYRLRADRDLSTIPLLLFSANDHVASVAQEVGAVGHVKKPVELDALVDIITDALTPRASDRT